MALPKLVGQTIIPPATLVGNFLGKSRKVRKGGLFNWFGKLELERPTILVAEFGPAC